MGDNTGLAGRLERYAQLRDDGCTRDEAKRTMHVSEATIARYERWYRKQRGLPPVKAWYTDEWWARSYGKLPGGELG